MSRKLRPIRGLVPGFFFAGRKYRIRSVYRSETKKWCPLWEGGKKIKHNTTGLDSLLSPFCFLGRGLAIGPSLITFGGVPKRYQISVKTGVVHFSSWRLLNICMMSTPWCPVNCGARIDDAGTESAPHPRLCRIDTDRGQRVLNQNPVATQSPRISR